jgi:hypothetical protein
VHRQAQGVAQGRGGGEGAPGLALSTSHRSPCMVMLLQSLGKARAGARLRSAPACCCAGLLPARHQEEVHPWLLGF